MREIGAGRCVRARFFGPSAGCLIRRQVGWLLHYERLLSPVLFRHVVERVGKQREAADQGRLQEQLKAPNEQPAECLVAEVDGSMLAIRGLEPWKEAKVGIVYHHNVKTRRPVKGSARYIVRFIDDGYELAQRLVVDWERLGERGFTRAATLVAELDAIPTLRSVEPAAT